MPDLPPKIEDDLKVLARATAKLDARDGGFRNFGQVSNLLAWTFKMKAEHDGCGRLEFDRRFVEDPSIVVAVTCPVHGIIEWGRWKTSTELAAEVELEPIVGTWFDADRY